MNNRRSVRANALWVAAVFALLVCQLRAEVAPAPAGDSKALTTASIKQLRREAAKRPRPLLFNDDGGAVVRRMTEPTAEDLLDKSLGYLAGTPVSTVLYCTKSTGLDLFTHHTKIGTLFTRRDGGYDTNQAGPLLEKGIDPLRVAMDFAKRNGKECFWSIRMNDTHDGSTAEYGPINLSANRFKTAHPEYMLGTAKKRPKHGYWTALDFGRPEVREHAFRIIEEVCRNYDVDGIELDFFRHPVYFKSVARGERATDEDRAVMTDLVRRIRAMTEEVGQLRGRPIVVGLRAHDSVPYASDIGLDLERWLAEELVDLYVPGSYFQFNEWEYSVALGHKYHVQVYSSIDDTRMKDVEGLESRVTKLAYRARAAQAWQAAADGVYLFNYPTQFERDAELYRELSDPQALATLDKDYFGSVRGMGRSAGGNLPYEPYTNIETLSPDRPKRIEAGETASARLTCAEDPEQAKSAKLTLRLKLPGAADRGDVQVSLNDVALKAISGTADWLEFSPAASAMRKGINTISVRLSPKAKKAVEWSDMVLEVRYPGKR